MPILNENTEHQFFCEGPSMCEPEHAERCDIVYQLKRMAKGLNPNWGASQSPQFGYDKMDNSLTDHRIALQKQMDEIQKLDLATITDEQFNKLHPNIQAIIYKQRENQKAAHKVKNDEKQKNDEITKNDKLENLSLLADMVVGKIDPTPTPTPTTKIKRSQS